MIVAPLRAEIAGKTRTALILLLSASGALLVDRLRQFDESAALARRSAGQGSRGARGTRRDPRQAGVPVSIESLVLAALGTLAGFAIALPAMRFLERVVPEAMGAARLTLDWRVLAFSTAAAIGSALTFGLAPALRGSHVAPQEALRDGGRGTAGSRRHWFQHSLIVIEMALAVVLLTCCGLLLQTFQHLRNTEVGLHERTAPDLRDAAVPLQGLPAACRLHQRRVGGRARHSGRGQRRCDQPHSVHERRRRDLPFAARAAPDPASRSRSRSFATSAATISRRSARRCTKADSSARRTRRPSSPWPSSTSRLPPVISKANLRSAEVQVWKYTVKKVTGTRLSAS